MSLSDVIAEHFRRVAHCHRTVVPGRPLLSAEERSNAEELLLREMSEGLLAVKSAAGELLRPRLLLVSNGTPKGSWAHVYYVSFHDPINSHGPRQGFYPVFLMSTDHRKLWLVLMLAAASVGVTGRGGWSRKKGQRLQERASLLRGHLRDTFHWRSGPIPLGPADEFLHTKPKSIQAVGRAYECGVIIGRDYEIEALPRDLGSQLARLWGLFDQIHQTEMAYVDSVLPRLSDEEHRDQLNAAVTGRQAEAVAIEWLRTHRSQWGVPLSRTDRVGLGYDIEFRQAGIYVEVKGFVAGLGPIRVTQCEWNAASQLGNSYYLCVVTDLDGPQGPSVRLLQNPYEALRSRVAEQRRVQITYSIPIQKADVLWLT